MTHLRSIKQNSGIYLIGYRNIYKVAFRIALTIWLLFILTSCKENENINPDISTSDGILKNKIDSIWTESMKNGTTPGMSVVIIKNGKAFFNKNYGFEDLEGKLPVTNSSRFAIGSTTKAMTAMGILNLVDKGILKRHEKVTTYMPDFVMRDERYKDITVAHLISNSSGIKSFNQLDAEDHSDNAAEHIISVLADEDLEFAPRQGFYYSNYGFALAGLLIQRVTGQSYESYMQDFLFSKIGMQHTTMEYWLPNAMGTTKAYVLDSANGYVESTPEFDRRYNSAGGGTITTPVDLSLYLTALANGFTTFSGHKLLSDSLITAMLNPVVNADNDDFIKYINASGNYGYGWYIVDRNGFKTIEHGGNIGSMLSYFFIDPVSKSAVGIMTNEQDFSKVFPIAEVAELVFKSN